MRIEPISKIPTLKQQLPKKELTINGCCVNIDIITGKATVWFDLNQFEVTVVHCKNCGSVKSTSNIKEIK
jgi:hypothetical protein|tara:strand:- start:485 stop:694 length:210 start_codon:yes stop_codon:yes gene_type:complete